jgi:hypothetical protein
MLATSPTHLILLSLFVLIMSGEEQVMTSFISFLQSAPISPLLSSLFSHTFSPCSSLNVTDQPYKNTGNVTVLYVLLCVVLENRRDACYDFALHSGDTSHT